MSSEHRASTAGSRPGTPLDDLLRGGRRLPALPALAGFGAGVAGATVLLPGVGAAGPVALLGAAGAAVAALLRSQRLLALAVIGVCLGVARAEVPPADAGLAGRAVSLAGLPVDVTGTVASDPALSSAGFQMLVRPIAITATGHLPSGTRVEPAGLLEVIVFRGDQPLQGDTIAFSGTLEVPADAPGFSWREALAAQGAYLEVSTGAVTIEAPARGAEAWLEFPARLRDAYIRAIQLVLPQPAASLLVGVVLGIRDGIPSATKSALTETGLVHLLVLSGLKVALFARLVLALLRPLFRRHAIWPVLALLILYCLVGGATPAAVRACGMGALGLSGAFFGRQTHVWTSLFALAAAMLAWSPALTLDLGFQLSFVGTASIVLFTPALERRLQVLPSIWREPFAVTVAAQIGTAPLLATGFGLLSPISPVANAVVLPLLPVLVGGGLLIAPLAAVPGVGALVALPLIAMVTFLQQVAAGLAQLPGAFLRVPAPAPWIGAVYYLALGGGLLAAREEGRRRRAVIALAVLGPLAVTGFEVGVWLHPAPGATVLAVGDGQAVLLRGPGGLILIDGGPQPGTLASALGQHLAPWERHLQALVITGGGAGHVGGLEGLPFTTDAVFGPAGGLTGSAWEEPVAAAAGEGASMHTLRAGQEADVAGLVLQALTPFRGQPPGGQLALRVVGPTHTFCDLADLDPVSVALAAGVLAGTCDALLVPDQGVTLPASAFLARARPRTLLVSDAAGARLGSGFSAAETQRTSQAGDITVPL